MLVPSLTGQLAAAGVIGVMSEVMRLHGNDSSVLLWAIKALANMTVDGEWITWLVYISYEQANDPPYTINGQPIPNLILRSVQQSSQPDSYEWDC